MGELYVNIYRDVGGDYCHEDWANNAVEAVDTLASQVNFGITNLTYGFEDISVTQTADYEEKNNSFVNELEKQGAVFGRDEYYMLITDNTDMGAGVTFKKVGPDGNPDGAKGIANAATRFMSSCFGGQDCLKPTVIHEICHSMFADHHEGRIDENFPYTVSPMQLWYTVDGCSGDNPVPDNNCNFNEDQNAEATAKTLSYCARSTIEDYVSTW